MWVDFSNRLKNPNRIQNSKGLEHPNNEKNSYGCKNYMGLGGGGVVI